MCGIAGVYRGTDRQSVIDMLDRIRHRGPDGWGCQELPNGVLGHRRLAILDAKGGRQPMEAEGAWIAFNGEIYNHLDLRQAHFPGKPFRTRTDTEVALRLYQKLGPKAIGQLDGMFALAIMKDGELFLARDPLGIKPLYIGEQEGRVYFASEIKALAQVCGEVREFPPGHWFHSRLGWHRFFDLEKLPSVAEYPDDEEAAARIRAVLERAVHKRLMSDVPLGVSLSGGLDSSIVARLARDRVPDLMTFAVGMRGSDDLKAARFAAQAIGTRHWEYEYTLADMKAALPFVLNHLESFDPALVRSAIANYFLARLAASHVKVFLTGEGADELYAGYAYLEGFQHPTALRAEQRRILSELHNTNLQRADRLSMAFGLEARVPFLDIESVTLALSLPAESMRVTQGRTEKALLRKAFAGLLPEEILQRRKQKFAQGAGSAELLVREAEEQVRDADFSAERNRLAQDWGYDLRSKEALYYYRILREDYQDEGILPNMGVSRSL